MSLISLFKRLSTVLISIRSHLLKHVPAAAHDAEAELKGLVSKHPSAPSKNEVSHPSAPSKTEDSSAWGNNLSPLERKVEQMENKLYVSYFNSSREDVLY